MDIPARLPSVNIDARRIGQVLDNLIYNAIKYSETGTEVMVSARQVEQELLRTRILASAKAVVADVMNRSRVREIFDTYKPSVVFHAAAYKHVPLMEANPTEAIEADILGTKKVAEAVTKGSFERAKLMNRIRFNLKLCRKYKVKTYFGNFAQQQFEMRSAKDLKSFWLVLGGNGLNCVEL